MLKKCKDVKYQQDTFKNHFSIKWNRFTNNLIILISNDTNKLVINLDLILFE